MRIVMLLAKSTGGIGIHVDALTRELRRLGHQVVIATDTLTADTFGWDAELLWPNNPGGMPGAARHLRHLARGADVVHAHGHQAGTLAALALTGLGRRDRPALVVSLHNAVLGGRRRQVAGRLTARPFARVAQLVTGASSALVEQARAWGAGWAELAPVPSPRVPALLAAPVLDLDERRARAADLLADQRIPAAPDADLVVTVARIAPQKDLPTLVAAAAMDREAGGPTDRVWVVVGGGDEALRAELEHQAREQGAPVHFVGAQSDPSEWLQAASLFVLTSHWEARALVVQEARAAGTPVIARDTGGLRDLVDGVGTLVAGADPVDWAAAVGEVIEGRGVWHTQSEAGRERAATWDDDAGNATRWVSLYARARAMT